MKKETKTLLWIFGVFFLLAFLNACLNASVGSTYKSKSPSSVYDLNSGEYDNFLKWKEQNR